VPVTEEQVMEALKECYDPHMPVSVVDLGLIYAVKIEDDKVQVDMTLTAPGCPMAGFIAQEVQFRLEKIEGVKGVKVNVVFDPPWTPDRISEEGKKQLGLA